MFSFFKRSENQKSPRLQRVTDTLSVTGQISAGDLTELASQGFKSVICNRPDGEGANQPGSAEIAAAAEALGMSFRAIPVVPGRIAQSDADAFQRALTEMPGPTAAYCRTGARSLSLHRMSQG